MASNLVFDVPKGNVSLIDFIGYINHVTDFGSGGILGVVAIIVTTSIIFLMTRSYGIERALSISLLFASIFSILLRPLNLVTDNITAICVILGFVGLWLLIKEDDKYEA